MAATGGHFLFFPPRGKLTSRLSTETIKCQRNLIDYNKKIGPREISVGIQVCGNFYSHCLCNFGILCRRKL